MASRVPFVVGTRGSRLALAQTGLVMQSIQAVQPTFQFELREIRTEGDRRPDASLAVIGGQGVFVKELESALLRGDIDVAVHSLKDMPADIAEGLTLAAFPPRGDVRDALVSRDGRTLSELPDGARIGTGSARRAVQLRHLRPDIQPVDIRGNVDTRIAKVDAGDYDAAVLAVAGLSRLDISGRASEVFDVAAMTPAVGQGALALQCRSDDGDMAAVLMTIDDDATRAACVAERAFLARLGGGCQLPFGAYAEIQDGSLRLRGFISDETGTQMYRGDTSGAIDAAQDLGVQLADSLLGQGAEAFVPAPEPR